MFRGRFFSLVVLVTVFTLILAICGFTAWSQGFALGQMAADGEGVVMSPVVVGNGLAPFMFGFGLLFKFACMSFIFLLMLGLTAKFLRLWYWRAAGGPQHRHWRKHWHHRHRGHKPPWYKEWDNEDSNSEANLGEGGVA